MSIYSSQQSFLANVLVLPIPRFCKNVSRHSVSSVSCEFPADDRNKDSPRKNENRLLKLAIVTLTAGVLTLVPVNEAFAAKTGGRVGGRAFRSAAPRSSSPRVGNSRTNIYVNPPVAPPLIGGYGVPFYGGWSPFSFFSPGPTVAIGVGGGFEFAALFIFLGAIAVAAKRFLGSTDEDDDVY